MSAYGRPWKGAPPSNVADRSVVDLVDSAHRRHGETDARLTEAGGSTGCGNAGPLISCKADYTVQDQANAMESMYSHRAARLQELGRNAELFQLSRRCKGGVRSQVPANREVCGMGQTPSELLMSRSKNVYQPNLAGSIYGAKLTSNVTSLQLHGTTNPSMGHKATQMALELLPMSQPNVPRDMEAKIHQFEQTAYRLVLRAFQAQSDTITWEKHTALTDLRAELQISDNLHRELLKTVGNDDDTIRQIREWRSRGGQASFHNNSYGKRKKTSGPGLNLPTPSPVMCSQQPAKPASSIVGKTVYPKGVKVDRGQNISGGSAIKSMSSPGGPSGRKPYMNTYFLGNHAGVGSQAQSINPLIGHKDLNRCPDDNKFYEAVMSDYNHETGQHKMVYDKNTSKEPWEWIDVKKVEKVCSSAHPDPLKMKQAKKALQIDVSDDDNDVIDVGGE